MSAAVILIVHNKMKGKKNNTKVVLRPQNPQKCAFCNQPEGDLFRLGTFYRLKYNGKYSYQIYDIL